VSGGGGLPVALRLQAQLAASGINVVTLFLADGVGNPGLPEDLGEGLLAFDVGAFPGKPLDTVVGDQVDVGMQT
jgi:hypothetical protein